MKIAKLVYLFFVALMFAACNTGEELPNPGEFNRSVEIQNMISRHNATRDDAGVGDLTPDILLNEIAQDQSDYMASIGEITHFDGTGHEVDFRANAIGYAWTDLAENIGYDNSPQDLYSAWLDSDNHHDNIVNADYEDIGVGVTLSGAYQYWCIVFGAQ